MYGENEDITADELDADIEDPEDIGDAFDDDDE